MALALNSQHSQFAFSFPVDFVPTDIENKYKSYLSRNQNIFDDIIDYLNNSIQQITFPGLTFPTAEQTHKFGKQITYRSAKSPYDIYTREFTITMASIDNNANYFMLQDILLWHYINTQSPFVNPFIIAVLDKNREINWQYELKEIVFTNMSSFVFGYQSTTQNKSDFTIQFKCNFIDVNYMSDSKQNILIKTKL